MLPEKKLTNPSDSAGPVEVPASEQSSLSFTLEPIFAVDPKRNAKADEAAQDDVAETASVTIDDAAEKSQPETVETVSIIIEESTDDAHSEIPEVYEIIIDEPVEEVRGDTTVSAESAAVEPTGEDEAETAKAVEFVELDVDGDQLYSVDRAETKNGEPKTHEAGMLWISGSLLLICAVVAMIVSFVHAMTADVIAAAAERERLAAIERIFGQDTAAEQIDPLAGMNAVYCIDGVDYCVNLTAAGFGGDMEMMVGVGADGSVRGVEIVSLAETPGLGSKVQDEAFLAQYVDKQGTLVLGEQIDAISGATVSSRAVTDGVNAALAALQDAGLIGGEGE
ncbi:MAG: FMN-binding protein [Clostridia bacterium]|nr:FMN-binding protein [Clostridia bacterium]